MKTNSRDWPPGPLRPTKPTSPPEAGMVIGLVAGSPLVALLALAFGHSRLALVVFASGWLLALLILLLSIYIRKGSR